MSLRIVGFWSRTIRSSYRVVEWLIQPYHSSTLFCKEVGEGLEIKMKEQKNYCVYKHTNKTNGKVYIGLTCQVPEHRWNHGNGYKGNPYFYSAIQKYGWDNFDHEVLFNNLTKEEAEQKEIDLISQYNSRDKKFGYNVLIGGGLGTLGLKMSKETRKKMSENRRGENNHFYGKSHSEESKLKMSKAKVGKYRGENNPNFGRHASEETRQKMSKMFKGRNARGESHLATKVYCVELDMSFDCIKDAREYLGTEVSIWTSASDKSHTVTSGVDPITKIPLHWIYCDELHMFSKEDRKSVV